MKSEKQLWPLLVSFENLLDASTKAQRGKRMRPDVAAFNARLEENLFNLQDSLESGLYEPGPYRTWTVYERKPRLICAAPYRDRVVHHALCNVVEPIFERSFIPDSYACRRGKGTHAAMRRVKQYAGRFGYVLRLDIRRYFPSIDHALLRQRLARRIADRRVMGLIDQLLATYGSEEPVVYFPGDDLFSAVERRRGLPVGNQTSQFFANVYLDGFDHFVKEELRCHGYVRYVDDLALFADDKPTLWSVLARVEEYVAGLRLRLHPCKRRIAPVSEGVEWVGYQVYPSHVRLRRDNPYTFQRRFRRVVRDVRRGDLSRQDALTRWAAWEGHARQADTVVLRRNVWRNTVSRASA